jgi:hypothetical protein
MQDTIAERKRHIRPSKNRGEANNFFEVDSLNQSTILLLIVIIHF